MTSVQASQWLGQAAGGAAALAILILVAEGWHPRTPLRASLRRRWLANALAYGASLGVLAALPALSLLGSTLVASERDWGLLNRLDVPLLPAVLLSVLLIDLAGYVVHRLEHRSAWLWRLHRLHHSDPDVDVTTTYRFHPFEGVLRAIVQALAALAIGMPPLAAVGYLILSMFTSVLSHANLAPPRALERALQWLVITPGLHRIHHSADRDEADSNFAVCLAGWDRLFGTHRQEPKNGHDQIAFGVASRSPMQATSALGLLIDPFLPEHPAGPLGERSIPEPDGAR